MPPRRRAEPARTDRGGAGPVRAFAARHRVLATLLVVLAVLVAGAAVAVPVVDGAARERAAEEVARRAQAELGLRSPPLVRIEGPLFLWQVVRGRYDGATIRSARLSYDGTDLGVTSVRLRDVRLAPSVLLGGSGTVTVAGGAVSTVAPWALLEERAGEAVGSEVTMRREGAEIAASADVAGVPVEVSLSPRVDDGVVVLRPSAVRLAGRELGLAAAGDLADRFGAGDAVDSLLGGFSYDPREAGEGAEQVEVRTAEVGRDGLVVGGALAPLELPVGG